MDRPRSEPRSPSASDALRSPDEATAGETPDPSNDAPDPPDAGPSRRERRPHDQTYKALFAHDVAIKSLIRDFLAAGGHDVLDLDTAELVPTETISPGLERRLADLAVRVWFKDSAASVVFLVEFQSSHDPGMALRTLGYATGAIEMLRANPKMLDPDGSVPLVLARVLHTGPEPWTAATSLAALTRTPAPPPGAVWACAGASTHSYEVLDLQSASAQDLLPEDSLLGWLGALERKPWDAFRRVHASLAKQWAGEEHASARRAFAKWTDERMRTAGVPAERRRVVERQIIQPEEAPEMEQTYEQWVEEQQRTGMAKGVKRGVKQGVARGHREMVLRLASRKFGAETAKRLEELVGVMEPEQLVQVFDAAVECDTGDDLLAEAANGISVVR